MHQTTSSSLPLRAAVFVGRQNETDDLVDLLDPTSLLTPKPVRFTSVYGIPGVGKSTLVAQVGNHLQDRGVDVYFVELVAVNDTETAIERIMSEFSVADIEKDARNTLQKFVKLLWRNTVLILDNCDRLLNSSLEKDRFSTMLENLMKQSRVLKIVTTSQIPFYKFDSDDARTVRIKPLSLESATSLVINTTGGDKVRKVKHDQAQRIAILCGQVPLALRIAGKLLEFGLLRAGELIKRLEEFPIETLSDDDITPRVQTTLELSFSLLKPQHRGHFLYFAVLPESFDNEVASAVIGDAKESTGKSIEILFRRGLLESPRNDCHYRMHPLLQAFGRTKLNPDDVQKIEHTIDRYYAERLMTVSDQPVGRAVKIFEKDREGFTQLVQRLSRNSSDSRDKQYYCLKIATTVWPKLTNKTIPWGQWIRLHRSCITAFEAEPRSYLVRYYVKAALQLSELYLFNITDLRSAVDVVRRVEPAVLADPPPFRVTLEYYSQFTALCRTAKDALSDGCLSTLNNSLRFFEPMLINKTNIDSLKKLNFSQFLVALKRETATFGNPQQAEVEVYLYLPFKFYLNSVRKSKRVYCMDSNSNTVEQTFWQKAKLFS